MGYLAGAAIAGCLGDVCGLLLLLLRTDYFPALVVTAVRADAVRQDGLFTVGAILDLHRLQVQVAAPLALAGVGGPSLGNCHGVFAYSGSTG